MKSEIHIEAKRNNETLACVNVTLEIEICNGMCQDVKSTVQSFIKEILANETVMNVLGLCQSERADLNNFSEGLKWCVHKKGGVQKHVARYPSGSETGSITLQIKKLTF